MSSNEVQERKNLILDKLAVERNRIMRQYGQLGVERNKLFKLTKLDLSEFNSAITLLVRDGTLVTIKGLVYEK